MNYLRPIPVAETGLYPPLLKMEVWTHFAIAATRGFDSKSFLKASGYRHH